VRTASAVTGGGGGQAFTRAPGAGAADGYFVVQSADGTLWKGTEAPAPKHFGAIDGTDITAGLQRWATYVATHDDDASWECTGYISSPVVSSVALDSENYARSIKGKIRLSASVSAVACLIEFNGFVQSSWGDGEYVGQTVWADRTVGCAFRFVGCKYMSGGDFYVLGCKRFGVELGYYTTEFKLD